MKLKREVEVELSISSDASWVFLGSKYESLINNDLNSYMLLAKANRNASFMLTAYRTTYELCIF